MRPPMISCPECRVRFLPRRIDQAYCSAACNANAMKRELARSRRVYRALYHWRFNRKSAAENLLFICREIAAWVREDREAQRLPPPPHDHMQDRGHQRRKRPVELVAKIRGTAA